MNDTMVEKEQLTINNINSIGEKSQGYMQVASAVHIDMQ
jgi:hypothetical protein